MPVMMTLKSLEVASETTPLKERLLKPYLLIRELWPTVKAQEKLVELKLFN